MRVLTRTVFATIAIATLLAVPVAAGAVTPEGGTNFVRNDTTFDAEFGGGDITTYRVFIDSDSVEFRVRTRTGVNPFTSVAWQQNNTYLQWFVDTGGSPGAEYYVIAHKDGAGGIEAAVRNMAGDLLCTAFFAYYGGNGYEIEAPAECLGGSTPRRFRAVFNYHRFGFDPQGFDRDLAPNAGWTPFL